MSNDNRRFSEMNQGVLHEVSVDCLGVPAATAVILAILGEEQIREMRNQVEDLSKRASHDEPQSHICRGVTLRIRGATLDDLSIRVTALQDRSFDIMLVIPDYQLGDEDGSYNYNRDRTVRDWAMSLKEIEGVESIYYGDGGQIRDGAPTNMFQWHQNGGSVNCG